MWAVPLLGEARCASQRRERSARNSRNEAHEKYGQYKNFFVHLFLFIFIIIITIIIIDSRVGFHRRDGTAQSLISH